MNENVEEKEREHGAKANEETGDCVDKQQMKVIIASIRYQEIRQRGDHFENVEK